VPSGKTPSKGYAQKQLSTVQRTLDQLKTGIPTVGRQSTAPVQPGGAKPTTNVVVPKPDTHVFNLTNWKKANPTGDANAARAAAVKQGFTVQE